MTKLKPDPQAVVDDILCMVPDNAVDQALHFAIDTERDLCESSFYHFFRRAWSVLEPTTKLKDNWHYKGICALLQKEAIRIIDKKPKTSDYVINICPRSGKSYLFTVIWNAWVWTRAPQIRFLTASYSETLSLQHAIKTRQLIQSEWYQGAWGEKFKLRFDQNRRSYFENDKGGYRIAISVGTGTGLGGDIVICDDPLNKEQSASPTYRTRAVEWWDGTMYSRLNNQETGLRIVVAQRLHEGDLCGHILERHRDTYKLIRIPNELNDDVEPKALKKHYVNGLFFPTMFNALVTEALKAGTNPYYYSGQYQQNPIPAGGGVLKRKWMRFWVPQGSKIPKHESRNGNEVVVHEQIELPALLDEHMDSWDCSFDKIGDASYVVGQYWASKNIDRFLLYQARERMNYPETVAAIRKNRAEFPLISTTLIERKANGPAAISELENEIPGIIGVVPIRSKEARATEESVGGVLPLSRQMESGHVYFPHPAIAPWVTDLIERFVAFPKGRFDDEIDAASQAVLKMTLVRRIWDANRLVREPFHVAFRDLSETSKLVASEWLDKDGSVSIVLGLWNGADVKLHIFWEQQYKNAAPEKVLLELSAVMRRLSTNAVRNLSRFDWYGNEQLFKKDGRNASSAYYKYKIRMRRNKNYDESGAIYGGSRLLMRRAVILHSRLKELPRQMAAWEYTDKGPASGFGLCRAFCGLVASLYEGGRYSEKQKKIKEYSEQGKRFTDTIATYARDGKLADAHVRQARGESLVPDQGQAAKDEWMFF